LNNSIYDDHNSTKFILLHQNITNKTDEFLISLSSKVPQIIYLTEHHLKSEQIGNLILGKYTLGAAFCRQTYKQGGAHIYASEDTEFNAINLEQHKKEKHLEICALKIRLLTNTFTIICINRYPSGNFTYFLHQLESILSKLYKTQTELTVCGDFNL
jgi:exonuclease III